MNEIQTIPADNNPLSIIASAVTKGVDADQLSKLVDLHQKIEAMNARRAYQQAMTECQAAMMVLIKDSVNSHTKSKYKDLGTLTYEIKPIYTRHGFSLSFSEGKSEEPGMIRCVCDVMHAQGHREQKWIDLPRDGTGAKGGSSSMNAVQGIGSTHTYARRYLSCDIFNLVIADEDLDGNMAEPTLNQGQIDMLEKLLLDTEADKSKFLEWAGVSRIADIPQKKFVNARDLLQAKLAKQKAVPA